MRKRIKGRKFTRTKHQRKALFKGLVRALVLNEKIVTTEAKAKDLSGIVEKVITRAKKGGLGSLRLLRRSWSEEVVNKLMKEIVPGYKERSGGYTRIIKLAPRESDGAKMAQIELVK